MRDRDGKYGNSLLGSSPLNDPDTIRTIYRQRVRLVIGRYRRNPSLRPIAEKLGISHPTLAKILKNRNHHVSKKTMLRIIKATTAKQLPYRISGHFKGRIPACPK